MYARAISRSDGPALKALFEACECRCFCRYFHFEGDKNDWLARCFGDVESNERELAERVQAGHDEALGVVAVEGDVIVGWLKLSPRASVTKAYDQRLYRGLPALDAGREGVFFLGCALVAPSARHGGVATALVAAAVKLGRARGARLLEAFPRRPRESVRDEELWTIPVGALTANGFRHVAGEDPYPVLQRSLEAPARKKEPAGIVLIDKPTGMTSHDVVGRMRKRLGTRRVGHAGTLDPMATGLLLVLFGEGTKLEPYLSVADKAYEAVIAFGKGTDTLDAEGQTIEEAPPSPALFAELRSLAVDIESDVPLLQAALDGERARREQVPPAFSAIKVDGVRSHERARKGEALELPARQVRSLALEITGASVPAGGYPTLALAMTVTKGYYVRSLARDLGTALGCPAHLTALRRTASGPFSIHDAVSLDAPDSALRARFISALDIAKRLLPSVALDAEEERRIRFGNPLELDVARISRQTELGPVALTNAAGDALVAIATLEAGTLTVARGFA